MTYCDRIRGAAIGLAAILGVGLPAQAREYTFSVTNFTDLDLHTLQVSPSDSDSWGENQLPTQVVKANGGEQSISISSPSESCYYDVQGIFSEATPPPEDAPEITFWAVDLCKLEGGLVFFPSDLYGQSDEINEKLIRVVNTTPSTLLGLLLPPSEANAEPVDLLQNTYVGPREYAAVKPPSNPSSTSCRYDLTAYFVDDASLLGGNIPAEAVRQETLPAADLCENRTLTLGNGPIKNVSVQNTTRLMLSELYLSPASEEGWGIDQLIDILEPGEQELVPLPIKMSANGDCESYDVLGIFYSDPDSPNPVFYEDHGINVCDADAVTLDFSNADRFGSEVPKE